MNDETAEASWIMGGLSGTIAHPPKETIITATVNEFLIGFNV